MRGHRVWMLVAGALALLVATTGTAQGGGAAAGVVGAERVRVPVAGPLPAKYDWLQFGLTPDKRSDDTAETILNRSNVGQLKQLFSNPLPDAPDGAPVLLTGVATATGARDLVYVKGEHGHLWAFDAHTGAQVWMTNLNNGCAACYDNSAPAIGPDRRFIYAGGFDGKIHKLNVADGSEVTGGGWPEVSTHPMTGSGQKFSMQLSWAIAKDGHPYLYAGHSNGGDGHFTVVNLDTGAQHVFNSSCSEHPDVHPGVDGACERGGAHPWSRGAVYDASLDLTFFDTGTNENSTYAPGSSWPDTFLAVPPDGSTRLAAGGGFPADSYTPANFAANESSDQDEGSGGLQLLPVGINSKFPHLGVIGGKDHRLKLVDLANLSGQGGPGHTGGELQMIQAPELSMIRSMAAGWTNPADGSAWVFVAAERGLEAFKLTADAAGNPQLVPQWMASHGFTASPVVADNMVFAAFGAGEHSPSQPFHHLEALDPTTGAVLWDVPTDAHHWSSPIVANGVVYMAEGAAGDGFAGTSGSFVAWALPGGGCGTGNDFSINVTPPTQTVAQGSSATYTVGTQVTCNAAENINLSLAGGLPPGATATFSPNPVPAGHSATLTIATTATTTPNSYPLTVVGTSPSASHNAGATLVVQGGGGSNDFSVSVMPTSQTVGQGGSVAYAVSTTVTAGSASPVTLSAGGLPAGATATFSANPVTSGSSSTLTVATSASTPAGTYTLAVTGQNASFSHAATPAPTLTVTCSGSCGPGISNLSVKDTTNAAHWSIQQNLQVGNLIYGDRTYHFTRVPATLAGSSWIRTAGASKTYRGNPLVTFTVGQQSNDVYVGMDRRAHRPGWLDATWTDTGTSLAGSEGVTYELFRKTFPAGTVALGPLAAPTAGSAVANYTVIVR